MLAHAGALAPPEALRWLLAHRLILLEAEPGLAADLKRELVSTRVQIAAGNALAVQAFQEVTDVLDPTAVMPLKGIVLLETLYSEKPGTRPLKDIDLLVPEADVDEAIARLEPLGWNEVPHSRQQRGLDHERTLKKGWLTLDIHQRLSFVYGHHTQFNQLPKLRSTLHGRSVFCLTPAAELVYAVVHCYKHGLFSSLLWIDEIVALAERGAHISRNEVTGIARQMGCRHPLAVATILLREALGSDILPQVDLKALAPSDFRLALQRELFAPSTVDLFQPFPLPSKFKEKFHSALLADSGRDTAYELWRSIRLTLRARLGRGRSVTWSGDGP